MPALTDDWVAGLVAGSATAPARPGVDAVVAICVGTENRRVVAIRDGRVTGPTDAEPEVELSVTAAQLDALAAGALSLARAYMRGDLKPVGSSGALAVLVEVFEDERTWSALRH